MRIFLKALFFIVACSFSSIVHATCDSLKNVVKTAKGESYIDALNSYADCFLWSDIQKFDSLSTLALNAAKKLNYTEGVAAATENKGLAISLSLNNPKKAMGYFQLAIQLYENLGDSMAVGKLLGDLANCQARLGQNGAALKNLIRGSRIFEANDFTRGISVYSNNIANILTNSNDLAEATVYYHKALGLIDTLTDRKNYSIQLGNLLMSGILMQNKDSIDVYLPRTLRIQKELGLDKEIAGTYGNMQSYYQDIKRIENPLFAVRSAYLDSELYYAARSKDELTLMLANLHKGLLLNDRGAGKQSYVYLKRATEMGKAMLDVGEELMEGYLIRSELSAKSGRYNDAYTELLQAYAWRDTVFARQLESSLLEVKTKFKVDQTLKELELVKKDKALADAELKQAQAENEKKQAIAANKQVVIYAVSVGLGLALLLAFIGYRAYLNKRKANEIITAQKAEVEAQQHQIEVQKMSVEQKNQEMIDSINYAGRIQQANLPSQQLLDDYFTNAFVLYKPKDIVSGDFYWMHKSNEKRYFAVADCTGYGVPGAIVSVICGNSLTAAAEQLEGENPAEILDETQKRVVAELSKNDDALKDGMDIGLCAINGYELSFAGAKRPLWICREHEIIEVFGDQQSLGLQNKVTPFNNHTVDLKPGDVVYLFSNGFIDQFGGEDGKKLKVANLKRLVIAMHTFESFKQKNMINKAFEDWKGNMEQLDDICMMGVKIA